MIGRTNKYDAAVELTRMIVENRKDRGTYYFEDDIEKIYKRMRRIIEDEENNYKVNSKSKEDS